jgi:hypothetical protein
MAVYRSFQEAHLIVLIVLRGSSDFMCWSICSTRDCGLVFDIFFLSRGFVANYTVARHERAQRWRPLHGRIQHRRA